MQAIVVAGGRGTRLKALTATTPKPMLEVQGRPILEHTLNLLKANGIKDLIFALCYRPDVITDYFGDGQKFGVHIDYTFEAEDQPLGTAGAILPARQFTQQTFIVTYADIIRQLAIKDMIKFHHQSRALATLNVYQRTGLNPRSALAFDQSHRLTKFIEHPPTTGKADQVVWSNASFYILEPEIFKFIPAHQASDFGRDIFPRLLADKQTVMAFPSHGYFIDIGTQEKLEQARRSPFLS